MKIKKINGKTVKGYVEWLKKEDMGCCHFNIGDTDNYRMHICVGWHDNGEKWVVAWKIGMETFNNAMQSDLDVDFIMPYDDEGNVYDTLQEIEGDDIDWDALAAEMNETAEKVYKWQLDNTGYKSVDELTKDQFEELRQKMIVDIETRKGFIVPDSWYDDTGDFTDEAVKKFYEGTYFVDEDFTPANGEEAA